jgi:TRAP-type uncharacterized transport system fused permease subunit
MGTVSEIILSVIAASIGVFFLGAACAGYLYRPLAWWKCGLFGAASLLLLLPKWSGAALALDAAGLALGVGLLLWEWSRSSPRTAQAAVGSA